MLQRNTGRGISSQDDSEINIERLWMDQNLGVGLYITGGGAMTLEDVVITDTDPSPCEGCQLPDDGFGMAIFGGSNAEMRRFNIARNGLVGMLVEDSSLSLFDGLIAEHLIGVNIKGGNINLRDSFHNVYLDGNQVDVDSRDLTTPDAAQVLTEE